MKKASKLRWIKYFLITVAAVIGLIAVTQFPFDVDRPSSPEELAKTRLYYGEAYKKSGNTAPDIPASDYDTKYLRMAQVAAQEMHITEQVSEFVSRYGLRDKAVLDVGSGRGYLQDMAENYTGLDISPTVSRFYHKRFVLGSATAMPFPDNSFDGGWSIWVLEHVPNPEQALREIRRVMKNNAVLFLEPAWDCAPWAAEGYTVRPYSDFGWKGKLVKASIPVRLSTPFKVAARLPARIVREVAGLTGPTRLHYRRLVPNYKEYWVPDSDAVNAIDFHEAMLWFLTRGDESLGYGTGPASSYMRKGGALVIRIHK